MPTGAAPARRRGGGRGRSRSRTPAGRRRAAPSPSPSPVGRVAAAAAAGGAAQAAADPDTPAVYVPPDEPPYKRYDFPPWQFLESFKFYISVNLCWWRRSNSSPRAQRLGLTVTRSTRAWLLFFAFLTEMFSIAIELAFGVLPSVYFAWRVRPWWQWWLNEPFIGIATNKVVFIVGVPLLLIVWGYHLFAMTRHRVHYSPTYMLWPKGEYPVALVEAVSRYSTMKKIGGLFKLFSSAIGKINGPGPMLFLITVVFLESDPREATGDATSLTLPGCEPPRCSARYSTLTLLSFSFIVLFTSRFLAALTLNTLRYERPDNGSCDSISASLCQHEPSATEVGFLIHGIVTVSVASVCAFYVNGNPGTFRIMLYLFRMTLVTLGGLLVFMHPLPEQKLESDEDGSQLVLRSRMEFDDYLLMFMSIALLLYSLFLQGWYAMFDVPFTFYFDRVAQYGDYWQGYVLDFVLFVLIFFLRQMLGSLTANDSRARLHSEALHFTAVGCFVASTLLLATTELVAVRMPFFFILKLEYVIPFIFAFQQLEHETPEGFLGRKCYSEEDRRKPINQTYSRRDPSLTEAERKEIMIDKARCRVYNEFRLILQCMEVIVFAFFLDWMYLAEDVDTSPALGLALDLPQAP